MNCRTERKCSIFPSDHHLHIYSKGTIPLDVAAPTPRVQIFLALDVADRDWDCLDGIRIHSVPWSRPSLVGDRSAIAREDINFAEN